MQKTLNTQEESATEIKSEIARLITYGGPQLIPVLTTIIHRYGEIENVSIEEIREWQNHMRYLNPQVTYDDLKFLIRMLEPILELLPGVSQMFSKYDVLTYIQQTALHVQKAHAMIYNQTPVSSLAGNY